ncbi:MAG: ATP-binding protein, partial [Chloracidobacterium sp.]|nr:ATP-binding protein [Chloracidobacterium sp.]
MRYFNTAGPCRPDIHLALAQQLTAEGRYAAVLLSLEVGAAFEDDVGAAESAILSVWRSALEVRLPEALQPPPWSDAPPGGRINRALGEWARWSARPVVVFLDEIDALRDAVLVSVLRQLRDGYALRPAGFPWSLALIGLRDVRDY